MKSLEHIIREIREGKAEKGSKKTLEGSIRKVMKGEKESSFADKTTKPITDDVGGLAGSGTGGEPKLHAEAIGVIGTDDYKGNQFKSVRTQTPHIKPPAGPGSHSQAPENVSRQRTLAKERSSMTLHGKVTEQVAAPAIRIATPVVGAGVAAGAAAAAAGKPAAEVLKTAGSAAKQKAEKYGKYFDIMTQPVAPEDLARAQEKIKATTSNLEAPPKQEIKPGAPPPIMTMKPPEAPAKLSADRPAMPGIVSAGKPTAPPIAEPLKPTAPAIVKPGEVAVPKTQVDAKAVTQTQAVPKVDTKAETGTATAAKTAVDTATATSEPEKGNKKFPMSFGAMATPDVFGAQKGITSKHPTASRARGHRRHVSEEVANEIRKKIQNTPRPDAGDRKSIEYVGRKDSDPKSDKQKTSRLATIKNVIDEAKKIKFEAEFGKEKKYVYPNDTEVVIGPNMKRNFLDVEDSKLPKDYENK